MIIPSLPSMKLSFSFVFAGLLLVPTAFAAPGDYKKIECSTASYFAANSCDECFDGGKITLGQKITGLGDTWTNTNTGTDQLFYEDEQKTPELINLAGTGTVWMANPTDPTKFWKFGNEVIFTPETGTGTVKRNVYTLKAKKSVLVLDSAFGAHYTLANTNKKDGEAIGLIKFPLNYRDVNDTTGRAGELKTHNECVALKASVATAAAVTPVVTPPTKPTPPTATQVKTGAADTFLFLGLAMLLALAFMFARKRKSI